MLRATLCNIYLNLLLSGYLAQCFVLLTANIEDIKQIAKKFLSESVSEQLADFLTKAKTHDTISEENERNAQEDRNSREMEQPAYNELKNPERTIGYAEKAKLAYNNAMNKMDIALNPKHRQKQLLRNDRHKNIGKRHKKADSNIIGPASNYIQNNPQMDYQNLIQYSKQKKVIRMNPIINPVAQMNSFGGNNIKRIRMTTPRPQRNEFDQYDHFNLKNDYYLATSGQIALKRIRRVGNP